MNSDKLFSIIARVFAVPITKINYETSQENIETWDSFSVYILLDEIEKEFEVKFSLDEVLEIKNVGDIKRILEK